jgi:hypothetical protein
MSERCRWTLGIVGTLLALLILINGLGTVLLAPDLGIVGPLAAWPG